MYDRALEIDPNYVSAYVYKGDRVSLFVKETHYTN